MLQIDTVSLPIKILRQVAKRWHVIPPWLFQRYKNYERRATSHSPLRCHKVGGHFIKTRKAAGQLKRNGGPSNLTIATTYWKKQSVRNSDSRKSYFQACVSSKRKKPNILVGFYPAREYRTLEELGGQRSKMIALKEQHVSTPAEKCPEYAKRCAAPNTTLARTTHLVWR